jgi:gentisate 1,2-dioxygenase
MRADQNYPPEHLAFYRKIDAQNMTPLWTVMGDLVTAEPRSACVPGYWPFSQVRQAALEAGALISTQQAERRVLVLENPGMRGRSQITTSLYAGVQLVLPGELARAHRHAAAALRFILEGDGAHTVVDGDRILMHPGDFIVTPSWSWHEHGNESDRPVFWLDGLDVPLIQFLDTSFAENLGEERHPGARTAEQPSVGQQTDILPVNRLHATQAAAAYGYPYVRSRETLERMMHGEAWDACHGLKLRYTDPATGGHALPTIGAWLQLLPGGLMTERYRSTAATVFAVAEGRGRSIIGNDLTIEWREHDVFVVPSWTHVRHYSAESAVLFSFSDQPIQEMLGLFHEQRGGAARDAT